MNNLDTSTNNFEQLGDHDKFLILVNEIKSMIENTNFDEGVPNNLVLKIDQLKSFLDEKSDSLQITDFFTASDLLENAKELLEKYKPVTSADTDTTVENKKTTDELQNDILEGKKYPEVKELIDFVDSVEIATTTAEDLAEIITQISEKIDVIETTIVPTASLFEQGIINLQIRRQQRKLATFERQLLAKENLNDNESFFLQFKQQIDDITQKMLEADYDPTTESIDFEKRLVLAKKIHDALVSKGEILKADALESEYILPAEQLSRSIQDRITKIQTDSFLSKPEYIALKNKIEETAPTTIPSLQAAIASIGTLQATFESAQGESPPEIIKELTKTFIEQVENKVSELTKLKDKLERAEQASNLRALLFTLRTVAASRTPQQLENLRELITQVETNCQKERDLGNAVLAQEWMDQLVLPSRELLINLARESFQNRNEYKIVQQSVSRFETMLTTPGEFEKYFAGRDTARQEATRIVANFIKAIQTLRELTDLTVEQIELRDALIVKAEQLVKPLQKELESFIPSSQELIQMVDEIITALTLGASYQKFDQETFTHEFMELNPKLTKQFQIWNSTLQEIDGRGENVPEIVKHTVNMLRLKIEGYNFVHVESMSDGFVKPTDSEKVLNDFWNRATKYAPQNLRETLLYYGVIGPQTGQTEKFRRKTGLSKDFADVIRDTYFKFFSGAEGEKHLKEGYIPVRVEKVQAVDDEGNIFLKEVLFLDQNFGFQVEKMNSKHGMLNDAMLKGQFQRKGQTYKVIDISNSDYQNLSDQVKKGEAPLDDAFVNSRLFLGLDHTDDLIKGITEPQKRQRVFNPDTGVNKLVFGVVQDLVLLDVQARYRINREARGSSPIAQENYDGSTYAKTMSRLAQDLYKFQSKPGESLPFDVLYLHPDYLEPLPDGTVPKTINIEARYAVAEKVWHILKNQAKEFSLTSLLGIPKKQEGKVLEFLNKEYEHGDLHKLLGLMGENRMLFNLKDENSVTFPPYSNFLLGGINISEMFLAIKGWKQLCGLDLSPITKGEKLDEEEIGKKFADLIDKGYSLSKLSRTESFETVRTLFGVYLTALIIKSEHNFANKHKFSEANRLDHVVIEEVGYQMLRASTMSNMNKAEGDDETTFGLYKFEIFCDLFSKESVDAWIRRDFGGDRALAQKDILKKANLLKEEFFEHVTQHCKLKINEKLKLDLRETALKKLFISEQRKKFLYGYKSGALKKVMGLGWDVFVGFPAKIGLGSLGRTIQHLKKTK